MGVVQEDEWVNDHAPAWQRQFNIANDSDDSIIIHKKYAMFRKNGTFTYYRKDYDIALIRLNYPVADERTGMKINLPCLLGKITNFEEWVSCLTELSTALLLCPYVYLHPHLSMTQEEQQLLLVSE